MGIVAGSRVGFIGFPTLHFLAGAFRGIEGSHPFLSDVSACSPSVYYRASRRSDAALAWAAMTEAIVALVAGLGGAAIAFSASSLTRRSEDRRPWLEKLADSFISYYHLSSEYTRRCHRLASGHSIENVQFSMSELRRAQGSILFLTGDSNIEAAIETVAAAAKSLHWVTLDVTSGKLESDGSEFVDAARAHRDAVQSFAQVSRSALRHRIVL